MFILGAEDSDPQTIPGASGMVKPMVIIPTDKERQEAMWDIYRMHKLFHINIAVRVASCEFILDPNWSPVNSYLIN